jgi:hypothetical protein
VKVQVLERMMTCVGLTVDRPSPADAGKILKGTDAQGTNQFLQDMAHAGIVLWVLGCVWTTRRL